LNVNKDLVLNSVIAWSFYPKLLSRDGKGWRNVSNNQTVSIHPTSVNRGCKGSIRWLSFYHIMQSSNKFYNAHETTAGEDFTVALLCGDAEFKLYSGVIVIDGNRVRMAVGDWKVMLALKALRARLRDIMSQSFRSPGQRLSPQQEKWFEIWQQIFTRQNVLREKQQAS
jgi:ATP-dependent RNA helicase DHX29